MSLTTAFTGYPPVSPARGLFSLADVSASELDTLVSRSCDLYRDPDGHDSPLRGCAVGIMFTRTSTRTRTAFTVGTLRLGGQPVTYGPNDLQTNTGESLADTGRMFGVMLDGLVARTAGPLADLRTIADAAGIPVVNAMAAEEHPTQGVCDLATLRLHLGTTADRQVLYVGEGNNTATALAHGMARLPRTRVTFLTPPGYGLPGDVLKIAGDQATVAGGSMTEIHDPAEVPDRVDVVYTTRWQTTGSSKPDAGWRDTFRPFHVDQALLDRWPDALFMHDLPAHRGDEVAAAVLDGDRSIAWSQARMKLCSAMAVLEHLLKDRR
jgi:ornithine carbamoyltransferase/carbamoyltransferase